MHTLGSALPLARWVHTSAKEFNCALPCRQLMVRYHRSPRPEEFSRYWTLVLPLAVPVVTRHEVGLRVRVALIDVVLESSKGGGIRRLAQYGPSSAASYVCAPAGSAESCRRAHRTQRHSCLVNIDSHDDSATWPSPGCALQAGTAWMQRRARRVGQAAGSRRGRLGPERPSSATASTSRHSSSHDVGRPLVRNLNSRMECPVVTGATERP